MALDDQTIVGIFSLFAVFVVALLPIQRIHRWLGRMRARHRLADLESGFPAQIPHLSTDAFQTPPSAAAFVVPSVLDRPTPSELQASQGDPPSTGWMPRCPSSVFVLSRDSP